MELHNIDPYVQTQLYKLASSGLCSGVDGQMMMSLMVRPPLPGEESYERFAKEENAIFESLKRKAVSVRSVILMNVPFTRLHLRLLMFVFLVSLLKACDWIKRNRRHDMQP
jgi:hypothetical protein